MQLAMPDRSRDGQQSTGGHWDSKSLGHNRQNRSYRLGPHPQGELCTPSRSLVTGLDPRMGGRRTTPTHTHTYALARPLPQACGPRDREVLTHIHYSEQQSLGLRTMETECPSN